MKFIFSVVASLFKNQDSDTLNKMVKEHACKSDENAKVIITNVGGIMQVNVTVRDSQDDIVSRHEFFLVPMTKEVINKVGLAIENGYSEDEQRDMWGDETIDWANEMIKFSL